MKLKAGLGVLIFSLLSVVTVQAQQIGLPCSGDDPDATCPLDTWVIVLVIAASLYVSYRLFRRQKATTTSLEK